VAGVHFEPAMEDAGEPALVITVTGGRPAKRTPNGAAHPAEIIARRDAFAALTESTAPG
jgi:hypothetical protein